MSKQQEIQALINAKIVGQGSAIDAGSALPPILTGLNELAGSAVSPDSTDMTEAQQMAVRKNLGLYYEDSEQGGTINWDGNTEGLEVFDLGGVMTYKVADSPKDIPIAAFLGYTSENVTELTPFDSVADFSNDIPGATGRLILALNQSEGGVVVADQFRAEVEGVTLEADGIYFTSNIRSFAYDDYVREISKIPEKYLPDTPTPGTSDAVQYVPQELTEAQQMQARKNQGLYYDFPEEIKSANGWDAGETYGENHKFITSDTPLPDDIRGISDIQGSSMLYSIDDSQLPNYYLVNHNQYWPAFFLVILQESAEGTYANWPKGIYIRTSGLPTDYDEYCLKYAKAEELSQIPPKYIKDMYNEEDVIKMLNYDYTGDLEWEYRKVSDEVIEASAVIGHKFTSDVNYTMTDYTITEDMVIVADSTHPTRILYDASDQNNWAILIFPEDMEFEGHSFSKGVWFRDAGNVLNYNRIQSLEYGDVIVHQVPQKYVPQIGINAVKMTIPSNDREYYGLGFVVVHQSVPSREVVFSVEGKTVTSVTVISSDGTEDYGQDGAYTFSGSNSGFNFVEIETSDYTYYNAIVFVESSNE